MNEQKKINTSNYYDIMDKKEEIKKIEEKKLAKKNLLNYKLKGMAFEFIKLLFLILIITSVFWFKHLFPNFYNDTLLDTKTKIMQTIGLEDDSKANKKNEVIITNNTTQKDNIDIPEITVTGLIEQNPDKYVVFKYNNKIYTQKVGDKFSDDTYEITKISNKVLEIKDFNGNSFKLPINLKSNVK